jgi:hypothetical protein
LIWYNVFMGKVDEVKETLLKKIKAKTVEIGEL